MIPRVALVQGPVMMPSMLSALRLKEGRAHSWAGELAALPCTPGRAARAEWSRAVSADCFKAYAAASLPFIKAAQSEAARTKLQPAHQLVALHARSSAVPHPMPPRAHLVRGSTEGLLATLAHGSCQDHIAVGSKDSCMRVVELERICCRILVLNRPPEPCSIRSYMTHSRRTTCQIHG